MAQLMRMAPYCHSGIEHLTVSHLSSHTGLMQVLADPKRDYPSLGRILQMRHGRITSLSTDPNPGQQLSPVVKARHKERSIGK